MSNTSKGTLLIQSDVAKNPDAIYLSENDVVTLRYEKIQSWPNKSEIWALKYGIPSLAVSNVISNAFINTIYRRNFGLNIRQHSAALFSSLILTSIFPPAVTASFLHLTYFERLLKFSSASNECPICNEIRGLSIYLISGTLVSSGLAWLTNFYHASLYFTIKIPNLDSYLKAGKKREYFTKVAGIFKQTNKNVYGRFVGCLCLQTILASGVFFFQQKQFRQHIEPYQFTANEIKRIKN